MAGFINLLWLLLLPLLNTSVMIVDRVVAREEEGVVEDSGKENVEVDVDIVASGLPVAIIMVSWIDLLVISSRTV